MKRYRESQMDAEAVMWGVPKKSHKMPLDWKLVVSAKVVSYPFRCPWRTMMQFPRLVWRSDKFHMDCNLPWWVHTLVVHLETANEEFGTLFRTFGIISPCDPVQAVSKEIFEDISCVFFYFFLLITGYISSSGTKTDVFTSGSRWKISSVQQKMQVSLISAQILIQRLYKHSTIPQGNAFELSCNNAGICSNLNTTIICALQHTVRKDFIC